MTGTVRWGILGNAKIARDQVIPAIRLSARGHVQAVASLSGRGLYGPAPVTLHRSYEALLADPLVDAVYIPLPNNLHVDWTEKALRAGKHVLCEKPLAWDVAGIDRLIAARDASGRMAAEAFMVAHHPQWAYVRDLIADGAIGRLAHIDGVFTYFNDDPANIRNQSATEGGALGDIGVYPVVTARLATGQEPHTAHARAEMQDGVDLTTWAMLDFDGFTMSFYCSMRMIRHQAMRFHGTEGVIDVPAPFNPPDFDAARVILRRGEESLERRFPTDRQYVTQIDAFHAAMDGAPFAFPLEQSRANQAVLDRIRAAAS